MPSPQIDELFSEAVRCHQSGQTAEAEPLYRQLLAMVPNHPDGMQLLGVLLAQSGRIEEGKKLIRRAIELNPNAQYYGNLGFVLSGAGRQQEAIDCYRRAIALAPNVPELHNNLGSALLAMRQWDEAMESLKRALALRPEYPEAYFNVGTVLHEQRRLDEAIVAYRRALSLRPNYAEAWHNLANALRDLHCYDDAINCYRKAQAIGFDRFELHGNLGTALKDIGQLDKAMQSFRCALALKSDSIVESNLLCTLYLHPDSTPQSLHEAHRHWNDMHARPLGASIRRHENDPTPDRRLRIAYVSSDFRDHCQSFFTIPLLSHHDHKKFEIFCYSNVAFPDEMTHRIRSSVDEWRDISLMNDDQAALLVREDGIDILVDLTMHMERNRLLVFARKPAPVQVTWLAYPGTTGLEAIDYRLSDPYLDPGSDDAFYSERTCRLPASFWCYDPLTSHSAPDDLPARVAGCVTFGCLNSISKVTDQVVGLWAHVLGSVSDSRMRLLAPEGAARERVIQLFSQRRIGADRIEFIGWQARRDYLEQYHHIDLCLDPYPYPGHTTTLDSLWMGVPVVNLVGQTAASRGGLSLLSNVGLPELVARDVNEYVQIAADLASDRARLAHLRSTLRQQMLASPIMDAPQFSRDVEAAFRWMWRRWCGARN